MKTVTLQHDLIHAGNLILVNAKHPYRENIAKRTLLSVNLGSNHVLLDNHVVKFLSKLIDKLNGWEQIVAVSGWRSMRDQEEIYAWSLKNNNIAFTKKFVALPGCSEHQTGLAIDLALKQEHIDFICPNFPYSGICQTFRHTAIPYGFIERYPHDKENITGISHEPWHFRYVGAPHAEIMSSHGLVLEEYISFLKSYGFGLLGDSYFGFVANADLLRAIYEAMFRVFSYTRNGIFYAPVFLAMGAGMKKIRSGYKKEIIVSGFVLSVLLMVCEGLTLKHLDIQRHDSMYICLLPCMYFLFQIVLSINKIPVKPLRTISTWIYIMHPLFIVLVRGLAKFTHLERIFIENSMAHYIAVSLLSFAFAIFLQKVSERVHKQPFCTARAWIELDMDNLRQNVIALKGLLPQGGALMPAVKANAYGHGAVLISKGLNRLGIKFFCVATVSEGIELRRNGVKGDILVLSYTHPKQFSMLRKYQLTQAVIDYSYARLLNSYGKKLKVHLKIDTGMHRLGERSERIEKIYNIFSCKNLVITGAFTHLCSDETKTEPDMKYTIAQATTFYDVISVLNERGCSCGKLHLLASYGLINYPELAGDYVRVGIALYGVLSNRADLDSCPIDLRPVLSLKARVALTKDLYAGEAAGYGLQYVAEVDRKIAVLAIGYADGIPRALSCGHGKVLINGNEAPIIGRICMDQMLVDITDIPNVKSGDVAVLIGKSGQHEITAYDLAEESVTITNELLSRLGNRLNRIEV